MKELKTLRGVDGPKKEHPEEALCSLICSLRLRNENLKSWMDLWDKMFPFTNPLPDKISIGWIVFLEIEVKD